MQEKAQIHFVRCTLSEYADVERLKETDPDTLYFCSVPGGGFHLFLGDAPLTIYTQQQQKPQQ